jgi:hypothetical protein
MKKSLLICTLALLFSQAVSQNATGPSIAAELVSSGLFEGNTITVYRRHSDKIPYQVKTTDKLGSMREFYVIKHESDVFMYLMIEKKGKELLYYPLTWSDMSAISVRDINERSTDILKGAVAQVDKNNL